MSHVFPRNSRATLPRVSHGEGVYLVDKNGKKYLNCGDAAVSCLGHSDADVIRAIRDQVAKVAFAHSGFMTSDPAEALADLLVEHAPRDETRAIDRVYFVSGGSEAVEAALKLARQYHLENGEPTRSHVIARRQSYHGNTLGALSAGGNAWRREKFAPLLTDMSHIAPCYEYIGRNRDETAWEYGQRMACELETEITRIGAKNVMAFVAEPVVGATLGAVPAVPGYFEKIREICDRYGVLLILDEVMCGMGRCGDLFACSAENIVPDILCIAKGLGAGYQPIGAMLCTAKIHDRIAEGSGFFQHGHTYVGHPVACAAGLAVVQALVGRGLPQRAAEMGNVLREKLETTLGQHANIGDIRGRGLFLGLEIVQDRETKTPFDPTLGIAAKFKKQALENGLICYPMGGTRDGRIGDHILLAPPFIISSEELDALVDKLCCTLEQVLPPL